MLYLAPAIGSAGVYSADNRSIRHSQGIFKAVFDLVKEGEAVKVQGPSSRVVVMSENEYNEKAKIRRNAQYIAMLERSMQQARNGEVVNKTLEDLKAMEQ
jgi:antitoxin YefM